MNVNYLSVGTDWPVTFCTEYQTVYNAMTTKPTYSLAVKQNTMVAALVAGGYFSRMDLLYIFATDVNTADEALINWKNPGTFNADNVDATPWTSLEGYFPSTTSDYISTNWVASSNAVNGTQDSQAFGVYVRNNVAGNDNAWFGGNYSRLGIRNSANYAHFQVNDNTATWYGSGTITDSTGLWVASRTASDARAVYRNGSSITTSSQASSNFDNTEMHIFRRSGQPSILFQASIFFAMDAVADSTEANAIYTIFQNYMTSIGKQV